MEEEYYNTQSLISGGGTAPQRFFYGVGLGTCTIAFIWIYNNFYPVTTERLLTDAAFAWCKAEVYSERAFNAIGAVIAPFVNLFKTYTPEADLFLHSEDGSIIKTTCQDFLTYTDRNNWSFPYIEYYITNDEGDSCCRIYRSTEALVAELKSVSQSREENNENNGLSSSFGVLSVAVKYNDEENKCVEEIIEIPKCNYYITGNKLFDRDFLEKTLDISYLPEIYTITIVDNNVNQITLETNNRVEQSILLKNNGYETITLQKNDGQFNMDDCEDADATEEDDNNSNIGFFDWLTGNKPKEA